MCSRHAAYKSLVRHIPLHYTTLTCNVNRDAPLLPSICAGVNERRAEQGLGPVRVMYEKRQHATPQVRAMFYIGPEEAQFGSV